MSYDEYGQQYLTEDELVEMIHINPDLDLTKVLLEEPKKFNHFNRTLYAGFPKITRYKRPACSVEEFDKSNQAHWYMPKVVPLQRATIAMRDNLYLHKTYALQLLHDPLAI